MDDATLPAGAPTAGGELAEGMFVGRYRLRTKLGAGAMGVVWSADDPQLERQVAIKVVHPALARTPEASDRLFREARALAKLSHRSVVTVHDAGEIDGRLFLAMELVPGTTLGQMLRARSPAQAADWQRWLIMMIDAGQGLAAAHAKGVLHRDFKPDNVLVDAAGRVAVADFGLATLGATAADSGRLVAKNLELTTTGALVGTPMYMSAEALAGKPLDARADQFSFCVALYEALYDGKPFPVPSQGLDAIVALSDAIERGQVPEPSSQVPARVRAAIVRGLAFRPEDRWPTLGELLSELARSAGISTLRETTVPIPRTRKRHLPWIIAGLAVIAAAVALVVMLRSDDAPLTPKLLFGVATHTAIAIAPTGDRIAVASDSLEVHDLATGKIWSTSAPGQEVSYLELDDKEVRFSSAHVPGAPARWAYAGDGSVGMGPNLEGTWFGHTPTGELIGTRDHELRVVDARGQVARVHKAAMKLEIVIPSPDRRRVAYLQSGRFSGTVVVWDFEKDVAIETPRLDAPTALDWLDDHTLVLGTGVYAQPTLWRLPVGPDGFGERSELYTQRFGWFGFVRARRGDHPAIFAIDMRPNARTRMIERTEGGGSTVHDFDTATTTVALGWLDNQKFLAWARDTGIVEIRDGSHRLSKTKVVLRTEPANATMVGNVLIASVRTVKGREAIAWALDEDKPRWTDPNLVAVRCAGDRQAPCYAVIALDDTEQVVSIDPATGVLGKEIVYTGVIEDVSVESDGAMLHVADRKRGVINIDPDGGDHGLAAIGDTPWARSVACGMDGRLLIGGTAYKNVYRVGEMVDGKFAMLTETENDILSLVRPSDDGKRVLFLARTFAPEVVELEE